MNFCKVHRRTLRGVGIFLAVGGLYYLFVYITDWYIPCPVRAITGLSCPGCGISHLCTDLLQGDILSAARQNLGIATLVPVWLTAGLVYLIFRPASLKQNGRAFQVLLWSSVGFLVLFGILRNIPALSFLQPLYLQ